MEALLMTGSVADSLKRRGYVMEACHGNATLVFELWVNHGRRAACVLWVAIEGRKKSCHMAEWDCHGSLMMSSVSEGPMAATQGWLERLCEIGMAFGLAFPPEGSCYPDILTRAFARVMEHFPDSGPMRIAE